MPFDTYAFHILLDDLEWLKVYDFTHIFPYNEELPSGGLLSEPLWKAQNVVNRYFIVNALVLAV